MWGKINFPLEDKKEGNQNCSLNGVRYYLRKHLITEQVPLTIIVP